MTCNLEAKCEQIEMLDDYWHMIDGRINQLIDERMDAWLENRARDYLDICEAIDLYTKRAREVIDMRDALIDEYERMEALANA